MKLLDAGADPQQLRAEGIRAILGYPGEPSLDLLTASAREFQAHSTRSFGSRNPQEMNNPFWEAMIRSGVNSYQAGRHFGYGDNRFDGTYAPIWCAQRFGQSLTFLPDGRIVQVAGEHEDYYDPDFCIYNDVFVHDGQGNIAIYGYPEDVFPPTDFHTATLIGDSIYLIGSAGYPQLRRFGHTQLFRLDTKKFGIEVLDAEGEAPGWIYKHRAERISSHEIRVSGGTIATLADGKEEHADNSRGFILDVKRLVWRGEE
jgi:hypothetical protein